MFKKRELLLFSKDRLALGLFVSLVVAVLVLWIMTLIYAHPTDVQVPIRYSEYGFTYLYRDQWYALASFALFGVVVLLTNGWLAVKLRSQFRAVAIGLLVLSLFLLIVAIVVAAAVFRLAAYSL